MSSRKIRHGGQMRKASEIISRTKKYKYNKQGSLEEITGTNVLADDEFKFAGSKSSLRRMADLERNVSLLINKLTTTDGEADDGNDDDFDSNMNKDIRFKKDVQLGNGSSDAIDVAGHLDIKNGLTLGSTAQEVFRDLAGGMASTGLTFSDSGNTIKINESYTATRSYVDTAIANLSDSAPSTLNTLNELAAALGDDANFATTTATNIAAKVAKTSSQALRATDAITVSNDTITIHKGDGTSESVTTSDANSNTYLTGASFSTSNGVLTLTKNSGSVTVDLDGRFQPAGSYAASGTSIVAGNGLTGGGTLAASRTIHVGGGNGMTVTANGIAMSGSYTGSFTASGDVTAYSDESLKTNIQTIDGALGKVEAVRGVTFDRIADGSTSTGVVAQELLAVLPEAVHTDAEGVHSVAYGNITGLLIEAVKELSAEVKELKK